MRSKNRRAMSSPRRRADILGEGNDSAYVVARHKEVFFPAAWARYAEAKPGTLRIVPPDARLTGLEQDYRKMQEMIFGEPPTFERLLEVLREIEHAINVSEGN